MRQRSGFFNSLLVLKPLRKFGFKKNGATKPYPFLLLVPTVDPLPIQVNRPSQDRNMYWDDPVQSLRAEGLSLQFIDFYDFDDFGYIDLRYYRVKIVECMDHPEVLGRHALVEVGDASVEFREDATSPSE